MLQKEGLQEEMKEGLQEEAMGGFFLVKIIMLKL